MLSLLGKRLLQTIPTLIIVLFIVFVAARLIPSNPIQIIMGQHTNAAEEKVLKHEYGLDKPIPVQFVDYLWGLLHGNLGQSYIQRGVSVSSILSTEFPVTMQLAFQSLVFAIVLGLPLGTLAAIYHNQLPDRLAMLIVIALISIPSFVLGPILILEIALQLHWLPVAGWDSPVYTVLPTVTLGARTAAQLARFQRTSLLDVLSQDYIRTARAKGISRWNTIRRHALKNAALPVITAIGLNFGTLLTGSFVVETLFHVPGIGYQSIQSITNRDYPVIQGVALLVALVFITVNLITDLLYRLVDPRVRDMEQVS